MRTSFYKKTILLLILFLCSKNLFSQDLDITEVVAAPESAEEQNFEYRDYNLSVISTSNRSAGITAAADLKYAPLIALSEGVLINGVVHLFDRYILNAHYAQVNFNDIGNNFKKGFVWDNDIFSTNAFFHPYHGSLYFNSARANGLSFWESAPYTFIGSLTWEFLCENNYPSINDFISTSIGGIALGEITHRLSYLVLDDSKRGLERAGREILAGLISPVDLFNRVLTGEAWRYSLDEEDQRNYFKNKFYINFSVFNRFISDIDKNYDTSNAALGISALYGEPFTDKERLPYDFFIADISFNVIGNQPLIANASVIGLLAGKQWDKEPCSYFAGFFQHFEYYHSHSLTGNRKDLYEFAETASFGGGFYVKKQNNENKQPVFYGSLHANFILLGVSESDYYSVFERNYNFGSGYSVKLAALMNFSKSFSVFVNFKTYQIFTLNNKEDKEYNSIYDEYSVQGNSGNTLFGISVAGFGYRFNEDFSLSVEQYFFWRQTHYISFKDVSTKSMETRIKLTYSIFN